MSRKQQRECPVCGSTYDFDPYRLKAFGRGVTCSWACSYRYRAERKRRSVELVCSTCGATVTRSPAQIKSKHPGVYCSRACHYAGRTAGLTLRVVDQPYNLVAIVDRKALAAKAWATRRRLGKDHHTEETKARLREATARSIALRTDTVSKLEDVVAEVLDAAGIANVRQVAIRGDLGRFIAVVDFWLPDLGIFLEVNGTFWHTDPRTYPNGPIHDIQRRNAAAWDRKVRAIDALGIPLVIAWETDIRNNPAQAIETALGMAA